jgi:NADH-quinone oxidoreductase subunit E
VEELEEQLVDILTKDRKNRRFLIRLLQEVQSKLGYVPREAMVSIASFLDIPPGAVYSVATFYNQFRLNPRGKHAIDVCMGTACHLAGGSLVLEAMARELEIEVGGVTPDKQYGLDRVACVGCCALAPVTVIDDTIYPRMNSQKVEEVLVNIKAANHSKKSPDK